jgi:hypothetical protein
MSRSRKERKKWKFGDQTITLLEGEREVLLRLLINLNNLPILSFQDIQVVRLPRKFPVLFYKKLKFFLWGKNKCSPVLTRYLRSDDKWLEYDFSENGIAGGSEIYIHKPALTDLLNVIS